MREPYTGKTRRLETPEEEQTSHRYTFKRQWLIPPIILLLVLYLLFGGIVFGHLQTPAMYENDPGVHVVVTLLTRANVTLQTRLIWVGILVCCMIFLFDEAYIGIVLGAGWLIIMAGLLLWAASLI